MKRFLWLLLSLFFSLNLLQVAAQQVNVPLNRFYLLEVEKHLAHPDIPVHTAVKPYVESVINYDSIRTLENEIQGFRTFDSKFLRKLKYESFIVVDTGDFRLEIDPLFNFALNQDQFDQSLKADTTHFFTNTRGVRARGSITEKFSFETTFWENQSFFVQHLDSFVRQWDVVPGQGRVKPFKRTGYDYAWAAGYISYSPVKQFNVQFGHGRNFIGEGYRSLLISDNAFNYPHLKFNTSLFNNRVQYTNVFSSLQTLRRMQTQAQREELFVRKAGTFHYLSFILHPRVHLGLFEGIVWKNSDGNYPEPVNPMFFNPVMFVNTGLFSGDTVNNVVNGMNAKIKVLNKAFLYGQFVVSGLDFSRYGYQGGFRYFDFLGIKNLHLQGEYNHVEPYVYAFSNQIQNFAHYNQPLAHPLMAGFSEFVGFVNYRIKDFYIELRTSTAIVNRDVNSPSHNIFLPVVENGPDPDIIETNINWTSAAIGYIINRKTNMRFNVGVAQRGFSNAQGSQDSRIITFGLSTDLFNKYYDF